MSGTQSDGRRDRNSYDNPPTAATPTPKPKLPPDTVTLIVAGQSFIGWQDVQIVRGIELFPSHFILRLTEKLPGQPTLLSIDPGQTCKLMIGDDLVISGYVDSYQAKISTKGHEITVVGRSGTEDLVDADAGFTSGQETTSRMSFSSSTLLQLAQADRVKTPCRNGNEQHPNPAGSRRDRPLRERRQRRIYLAPAWRAAKFSHGLQDLCKPFGITVTEPDGEGSPRISVADGIPQFTIPLGTTVYDVLEPQAQVRQMLMLDGTDGNLVLAKVGTTMAASGFTLPGSVLEAQVSLNKQDRFTIYLPAFQAFDVAMDIPGPAQPLGNYQIPVRDDAAFKDQPRLDGQPRYRPHVVISPQPMGNMQLAELTASWEMARRYARSQAVTALVPLWRDSAGTLWTPNTLAQVNMPILKLQGLTWLISQVVFLKSLEAGTRTMVTLMPKEGFVPQPTFYTPFDPQLTPATQQALAARDGRRDQG